METKKMVLMILIVLITISLISCKTVQETNENDSLEKPDSPSEENLSHFNEKIYKINLGMDITEVDNILGEKPYSVTVAPSSTLAIADEVNRIYGNGLSIYTIGDTVFEMSINKEGIGLEKGITVGDNYDKLLQLLGEPNKKGENYLEYNFQQEEKTIIKTYDVDDNKIISIDYSSLEGGILKRNTIGTEDFTLGGINLKMKEGDFLKVYTDTPASIGVDESTELKQKLYKYADGIDICFVKNETDSEYEIYSIKFTNKALATSRGLKIGDSIGKVLDLYGFPLYDEGNILSYGYDGSEYSNFVIIIENNIVTEITISLTL